MNAPTPPGGGPSPAALARRLERETTALVRAAPPTPTEVAAARAVAEHVAAACAGGEKVGGAAAVAEALAQCLRDIERGAIAPGPVLMYVASAASVLATELHGQSLGSPGSASALTAARYELESFTPTRAERARPSAPDVPLGALRPGGQSAADR